MDIFNEHLIKRSKGLRENLLTAGIILGAIILGIVVIIVFALVPLLNGFGLLGAAGVGYGAYILLSRMNLEYEYIVTNGELDIDRIIARRSRKRVLNVHSRDFELCAPMNDPVFKSAFNAQATVLDYSSGKYDHLTYFALFSKDGQKMKLIFEPTNTMLRSFKMFAPRNIHGVQDDVL